MAAAAAALASNKNEPKVMCVSTQPKIQKSRNPNAQQEKTRRHFQLKRRQ
jgi:hypothetical protein